MNEKEGDTSAAHNLVSITDRVKHMENVADTITKKISKLRQISGMYDRLIDSRGFERMQVRFFRNLDSHYRATVSADFYNDGINEVREVLMNKYQAKMIALQKEIEKLAKEL